MHLKSFRFIATFVFVAALILSPAASAQSPLPPTAKLDQSLLAKVRAGDSANTRVIIRTSGNGVPGLKSALEASGNPVLRLHPRINALTALVPVVQLEGLSRLPSVVSISVDAVVTANQTMTVSNEPVVAEFTLRQTLGLPVQALTGNRIGVAVIDSGLEAGPEFDDRIFGFYDFTANGQAASPADGYGHGTHVAGTIAGDGILSNKRYRGVAPKARIIALKVLDQYGAGYTSDVIDAILFAIDNRGRLGIDIINLSLGHPIYEPAATDPLVQAVEAAVRAGIVVVTAAGNYGVSPSTAAPAYAGILSPGNAPSAITVGSVATFDTNSRTDDRVAAYSSRGPTWYDGRAKPDLVAPGHGIVAAAAKASRLYRENPFLRVGDSYLRLSGTSMATAVVSGTVALILEANRDAFGTRLTPNAIKAFLQFTALPARDYDGVEYNALTQGAGSVNPAGAVALAARVDASMPVSSWWLMSGVETWTTIDGETLSWSQRVVWSDTLGSGPLVYVNQPAWAYNIVWGTNDNIVWGSNENIVWGSNVVWGSNENIVWGSNVVWGNTLIGASNGSSITWGMAASTPSQTVWGLLGGGAGSTDSSQILVD